MLRSSLLNHENGPVICALSLRRGFWNTQSNVGFHLLSNPFDPLRNALRKAEYEEIGASF
jgi:hypothetical protein